MISNFCFLFDKGAQAPGNTYATGVLRTAQSPRKRYGRIVQVVNPRDGTPNVALQPQGMAAFGLPKV